MMLCEDRREQKVKYLFLALFLQTMVRIILLLSSLFLLGSKFSVQLWLFFDMADNKI